MTFLGQLTGASLLDAGFVDDDGQVRTEDLQAGRARLEAGVIAKMTKVAPHSGFEVRIVLIDLTKMSAAEFVPFALLLR